MKRAGSRGDRWLVILVPIISIAARPVEPAIKLEKAVHYATAGDEKLLLDIAIPPGDGPFPCVVCFHGGAWRYGSRRDLFGRIQGQDRQGRGQLDRGHRGQGLRRGIGELPSLAPRTSSRQ